MDWLAYGKILYFITVATELTFFIVGCGLLELIQAMHRYIVGLSAITEPQVGSIALPFIYHHHGLAD
ncbi:hypothetical protein VTN00DRAFT_2241 [Thermoascus crustaceus]|uniref:uncharacterized protein n=1 Tax=Thermoascus crustaceus TaxID=5088 RepID=UPI003742666F